MEQSAVDKLILAGATKAPTARPARATRLQCQSRYLLLQRNFLYASSQGGLPESMRRMFQATCKIERDFARQCRKALRFRSAMWICPSVSPRQIQRLQAELAERGEDTRAAVALAAAARGVKVAHIRRVAAYFAQQQAIEETRRLNRERRWEERRAAMSK